LQDGFVKHRWRATAGAIAVTAMCLIAAVAAAQDSEQTPDTDTLHGVILNSVTHEPIARALVASPDNHFATMTDSQGHFEFSLTKPQPGQAQTAASITDTRPSALVARKPGYLTEPTADAQLEPSTKDVTLTLVPEALIIGRVRVSESEGADKVQLELFRRQVQEGRAHWIPTGQATTRSNGEFRFAELPAGTYKVFTHESLDRDVTILPPERAEAYGYPPVFYPAANDFGGADAIDLSPGQTFETDLLITRQRYYTVKVPVTGMPPDGGLAISVSPVDSRGPGYTLGYSQQTRTLEGLLPQGNYLVQVVGFGSTTVSGESALTVREVPSAARMTLVPANPIAVNVKEEFTSAENGAESGETQAGNLRGVGRYLNLRLEAAEDFGSQNTIHLQPPSGHNDRSLVLEATPPGRYWVHIDASRGYAASVMAGGVDLLREPLVVATGAATPAIEITMRDDSAQIDGTVEGADPALTPYNVSLAAQLGINAPGGHTNFAYIYCLPTSDSPGRYTEAVALPDGTFTLPNLPPGAYRVLAFKHPQTDLEYQNPEAMRVWEAKGQIIHLTGGQKEHVTLPITTRGE